MRKSLLLLLFLTIGKHGLAETVYDNLDALISGGQHNDTDQVKTAQQFLLGKNRIVSSVTVRLEKFGDPDGTLNVEIWDDISNKPGMFVGTVGSINASDVVATGGVILFEYTFDSPVSGLTPNQPYYVVISTAKTNWDSSNHVAWGGTFDATGANGAGEAQVISLSTMDWHTLQDIPPDEGPAPFPVYLSASVNAISGLLGCGATCGDFDGDGVLSAADIDLLSAEVRNVSGNLSFDVNGDGQLDSADRSHWVHDNNFAHTYFGDANLDGEFSTADLIAVFQVGEYEDSVAGNSMWAEGDWNGNGDVETGDLILAFQDGGFEAGPRPATVPVPEPSGIVLLALAMVGISSRRRLGAN